MANQLSKSGITNSQTIQAWHVSQSVDALTGTSAYDIKISGSLTLTGSVESLNGFTGNLIGTSSWSDNAVTANTASWAENAISSSYAISASQAEYANTASYADQFNVATGLTASGLIYPTSDGITDQFITTDGAGSLSLDWVKTLHQNIRNVESVTIVKGTPLFVSGSTGDNANVYIADSNNPLRRPATLIAGDATLGPSATGTALISGEIQGVDTNAYPAGTIVYLAAGGGWTATRPTGSALVQVLGVVTRQNNNGRGIIFNQVGNNLPNITSGYAWIGDSDDVPQATATSSIIGAGSYGSSFPSGAAVTTPLVPIKFIAGASETDASGFRSITLNELQTGGVRILNQTFFVTTGVEDLDPTKTVSILPSSVAPLVQFTSSVSNTKFHYQIMYI